MESLVRSVITVALASSTMLSVHFCQQCCCKRGMCICYNHFATSGAGSEPIMRLRVAPFAGGWKSESRVARNECNEIKWDDEERFEVEVGH
jgi:hypothetical protein